MSNWTVAFLVFIFVGCHLLSWHRSKGQDAPVKQLTRLSFATLLFFLGWLFLIFNQPSLYVPEFDGVIDTVPDARNAIAQQNSVLRELAKEIKDYNLYMFLFLFVLAGNLVPALYSLSAALVTGKSNYEDFDDDRMISIFGDEK